MTSNEVTSDRAHLCQLKTLEALQALQDALSALADDLSAARHPGNESLWGDFETTGRVVLQVSAGLAQALVDWLAPMDLTYGDLDQVLRSIASREPKLKELADYGAEVFEFLRKISYAGAPDPQEAPDMDDFNGLLEQAVKLLEQEWMT